MQAKFKHLYVEKKLFHKICNFKIRRLFIQSFTLNKQDWH